MDFIKIIWSFIVSHQVLTSGFFAGCIALWGILTQRTISREKNSIDFETQISSNDSYRKAIRLVLSLTEDQIKSAIEGKNSDPNFVTITNTLNTWERCARSVHSNIYDEEYLYKVFGSTVIGLYSAYQPFIVNRQNTNPRYYIQFTAMASDWMHMRYKEEKKKDFSEQISEVLALKREQDFYSDLSNMTHAKHKGHAKEFHKQVKKLKRLIS
jgi:hypothetical protein